MRPGWAGFQASLSWQSLQSSSDLLTGMLIIPYKRPIKAVYIKELVKSAKAHMEVRNDRKRKG